MDQGKIVIVGSSDARARYYAQGASSCRPWSTGVGRSTLAPRMRTGIDFDALDVGCGTEAWQGYCTFSRTRSATSGVCGTTPTGRNLPDVSHTRAIARGATRCHGASELDVFGNC